MRRQDLRVVVGRSAATLIDDAMAAAALGLVLMVNLNVLRRGRTSPLAMPSRQVRLLVPLCVTLPAAAILAAMEHRGGTLGKRALGLQLTTVGDPRQSPGLPWGRAVARSLLKTALPWELGHQSVWELQADRRVPGSALAAAAYALLAAQLIGAARRDRRTYADRIAGSEVVARPVRGSRSAGPR